MTRAQIRGVVDEMVKAVDEKAREAILAKIDSQGEAALTIRVQILSRYNRFMEAQCRKKA